MVIVLKNMASIAYPLNLHKCLLNHSWANLKQSALNYVEFRLSKSTFVFQEQILS
jgi:hypothetical protein